MTPRMFVALLLIPAVYAQSQAELLEGDTLLQGCLDNASCSEFLLGVLSENMAEYGFALQYDPIATSALTGRGVGLVTEVAINSVVLGEKNVVTERLLLPPAVPRLAVGYQYGSYTYDDPYPQYAVGAFILPPVKILDGVLFSTGAHASLAVPVVSHVVWAGADLEYSWAHVGAPLIGTEAQLKTFDALEPYIERGASACDEIQAGCLDAFDQSVVTVRGGLSLEPFAGGFFYGRLSAAYVHQRLLVVYDGTTWGSGGIQPQAQFGAGFRAGDKYQMALGTSLASKPDALSTNNSRVMVKIDTSFSFRFGRPRYWEAKEPTEE